MRPLKSLLAALVLLLSASVALRAGEPEDFKAISELMDLGITRSALMRSKIYLERYSDGAHRPQVAAWAGGILLRNGDAAGAVPLLEEALLGLPPKDAEGALLDWAQAQEEVGQNREALAALDGFQPSDESLRDRADVIREKAKAAMGAPQAPQENAAGEPAPAEAPVAEAPKPREPASRPATIPVDEPPAKSQPSNALPLPMPKEPTAPAATETRDFPPPAAPAVPETRAVPSSAAPAPAAPPSSPPPEAANVQEPKAPPAPARVKGPERDALDAALALSSAGQDAKAADQLASLVARGNLDPESTREARLALAIARYRLKDYKGAISALASLTETAAPDSDALLLKAWCLRASGKDQAAFETARKGVPLKGWEEAEALFPLWLAKAERDPEKLLSFSKVIVDRNPDNPAAVQARVLSAGVLESRGDKAGALAALEEAIPKMPRGEQQFQASLQAARLAWTEVRDPRRAQRWLVLAEQTAESANDKAAAALARARLEWERGESTNAVEALSDLVKNYPKTDPIPDAYLLLGQIQVTEGNRDRGRESLEVVTHSFPDSKAAVEAWLILAESLAAEGRADEAAPVAKALEDAPLTDAQHARLTRLDDLLAQSLGRDAVPPPPKTPPPDSKAGREAAQRAVYEMGLGELAKGHHAAALEAAGRIRDPELADALRLRTADALVSSGKRPEARQLWSQLADEKDERAPLALWLLANSLLASEQLEQGLAALRQLAAYPPKEPLSVLAQHRLEMAFLAQKGPRAALDAIPEFRLAEPPAPGEEQADLEAAVQAVKKGNKQEAVKLYQLYLKRFPRGSGAPEARMYLGREAAARSDWPEAVRTLEGAPPGPERDYLLGMARYRTGDFKGAQEDLERALQTPLDLRPDQALPALYMAGDSARRQSKSADAVDHLSDYARVAKATPENKDRLLDAAMYLQHAEQYEAAISALDRLRKAFKDPPIAFQYAYTLELAGRLDEALAVFLQVGRGPSPMWAPTARYQAAEIYAQTGKTKEAIEIYKNIVISMKGTVQGNYAKQRLAELQAQLAAEQAAGAKQKPPEKKPAPAKKKPASTTPPVGPPAEKKG